MILQLNKNNLVVAYVVTGGLNGQVIELEQYHVTVWKRPEKKSKHLLA